MTTRSTETRWLGIVLGTALVVLGGLATADAWCAVEEPPSSGSRSDRALARDLRRAAGSADGEAIERGLTELELLLDVRHLPAEDPAGGLPAAAAAEPPGGVGGRTGRGDESGCVARPSLHSA